MRRKARTIVPNLFSFLLEIKQILVGRIESVLLSLSGRSIEAFKKRKRQRALWKQIPPPNEIFTFSELASNIEATVEF